MLVTSSLLRRRQDGFTMVELLVTILIVTVGILGLAKMQATAVSNTSVARTRALMTYQAESLAGSIRANRLFWVVDGAAATSPTFGVNSSGTPSYTLMDSSTPAGQTSCIGTNPCSAAQMAYDDMVRTWTAQFVLNFPGATASIACVSASGGTCAASPSKPNGYDITLTWNQKSVAMNKSTANSTTTPVSMIMHVQP